MVKTMIQQRLVCQSGQAAEPLQVIDTLPVPVCVYTRRVRDRLFKPHADYGHCAAKQLDFYGFKRGRRITRLGMITHYGLLPARPHDSQLVDELLDGFEGAALADKGLIDAFHQLELARKRAIELITPARRNMPIQRGALWAKQPFPPIGANALKPSVHNWLVGLPFNAFVCGISGTCNIASFAKSWPIPFVSGSTSSAVGPPWILMAYSPFRSCTSGSRSMPQFLRQSRGGGKIKEKG
jgi:hypothetical protein